MIGRLKGILVHKQPPWLVVDVNGVGYELEAPMSTFYDLPEVGREVALFTRYAQKEDSVSLYGFITEAERRMFRDVQKVTGIGAKIALAILSGASVNQFAALVQAGDITALTRIPGIGKKTAEQILLSLGDKVAALADELGAADRPQAPAQPEPEPPALVEEAKQVLVDLGWRVKEVEVALAKLTAAGTVTASLDDLVRRTLAQLMER